MELYYYPLSPPSRSVLMVIRHLQLDVQLKNVDIFQRENMTDEFLEMNPFHCVPTLNDKGFLLWESRAIMSYLVSKYAPGSNLYPDSPETRAIIDQMLYFDATTLHALLNKCISSILMNGAIDQSCAFDFFEKVALLDKYMDGKKFVTGPNLTLADYALLVTLTVATAIELDLNEFTNIVNWIETLKKEVTFYDEMLTKYIQEITKFFTDKIINRKEISDIDDKDGEENSVTDNENVEKSDEE